MRSEHAEQATAEGGAEVVIRQCGSGTLLMVVILLLMGSLLLHATRRQLSDNLSLVAAEGNDYRQAAAAASALAWGERLNWALADEQGWLCQQLQPQGWRACLRHGEPRSLLRADSGEQTQALWRWLGGTAGHLRALPHGWLDFCPLKEQGECDVPGTAAGL